MSNDARRFPSTDELQFLLDGPRLLDGMSDAEVAAFATRDPKGFDLVLLSFEQAADVNELLALAITRARVRLAAIAADARRAVH